MLKTSRRDFLKLSGCLTIGFSFGGISPDHFSPVIAELPESIKRHPNIDSWLEILANGKVRIFTGKAELGQGIRTAIAQVAAEELELQMENIEVVLADTARTPNEGYTVGSGSIEQSAMAVRYASAAAKMKLMKIAAQKLNVPEEQILFQNGEVYTKNSGKRLTFAALLDGKQITDQVTAPVTLKPRNKFTIVGKGIPRNDIREMAAGSYTYVQDLRFDGMVHARVVRPPSYEAKLKHFDALTVKNKIPGITIIHNGSFLAVIAEEEYDAVRAQKLLRLGAVWSEGSTFPSEGEKNLKDHIQKLPVQSERVHEQGKISSKRYTHKAAYFKPYIIHGSIGPSCSVALWDGKSLSVWSHSQGVYPLREALSKMLGLATDQIYVTGVPGSGCYGHNGADDVSADAAVIAMQYPGKHVRVQWSREEEHGWEPYGSAMVMEAAAQLDKTGKIIEWKYDLWSDTHSTRPGGNAENLLAARYLEKPFDVPSKGYIGGASRNSQPYYSIPNQLITSNFFKGPLRVSALRSLGAYANIFAIESFIDELALKAGMDPFEFRLMHLEDDRAKAVLHRLREMIHGQKTSAGEGIGIAFSRYKNTAAYCAVAALVSINASSQKLKVEKMWSAIDAGEVINIDGLINQTEGGMIQSASWTLKEQVTFDNRQITSTDWGSYQIIRFKDTPQVEVSVLNQPDEQVMGAGEAAQGSSCAAIANAVYRASGKRIRELPLQNEV
jgi:nicotinate dehydrogenase subunit B